MDYDQLALVRRRAGRRRRPRQRRPLGIEALTLAHRPPLPDRRQEAQLGADRSSAAAWSRSSSAQPLCGEASGGTLSRASPGTRATSLRGPQAGETTLLIDARGFPPEGDDCDATLAVKAYQARLAALHPLQHAAARDSTASGFGPAPTACGSTATTTRATTWPRGMDGLEIHVHGNAQDQLGQIAKRGKLVVYGDVGQTFLYGAKGGEVYVLGNAAGRPHDQRRRLARGWSSTAPPGLPGRVVHGRRSAQRRRLRHPQRRAITIDDGKLRPAGPCPIRAATCSRWPPAGRSTSATRTARWSTSSSTAGRIGRCRAADWRLILPYLEENERLFGIRIERDLLTVDGVLRLAGRGLPQGDAAQRRRGRGRDGRNGENRRMADDRFDHGTAAAWLDEVERRSGTPVSACFQCHKCTHRLPDRPGHGSAAQPGDAAGASGRGGRGARSRRRSGCAPRARPAPRAARMEHRHRRRDGRPADAWPSSARPPCPTRHGKQFNRSFLGSVRHHGRVFEVGMMAAYKLRTGDLFSDVDKVPADAGQGKTLAAAQAQRQRQAKCARSSAGPKRRKDNREIRLLSRLQPRIHRVGLRPLHAGRLPRAGHRAGRDPRLGLLRLDAGPCQQRLAGRGPAGVEPAEGPGAWAGPC